MNRKHFLSGIKRLYQAKVFSLQGLFHHAEFPAVGCCGNTRVYCLHKDIKQKAPTSRGPFIALKPYYFLPPLTLAIIKMMSAIKPTTTKMPQTIPALKIPLTIVQLPKLKTKKEASRKIIDLILFCFIQSYYTYQIAYLFSFT
jgi:hypothetical protein